MNLCQRLCGFFLIIRLKLYALNMHHIHHTPLFEISLLVDPCRGAQGVKDEIGVVQVICANDASDGDLWGRTNLFHRG